MLDIMLRTLSQHLETVDRFLNISNVLPEDKGQSAHVCHNSYRPILQAALLFNAESLNIICLERSTHK